ncbi:MAG TPA: LPS export ABC transporter periplasmic protein LptC, partial [Candidatus Acidoferrales bacterium]|nr:LPS export ABC transporter periplasmic protein LptC [Candidatus Acidoferrales bacterium]
LPATVGTDVQQQAEKFTFSRTQEGQTLFTVEASRTTERAGRTTVLEDVLVRIYGQRGERADEIRTTRCEYDAGRTERIICPGEVIVLLRNSGAAEAARAPSIQLTTTALQFDPNESVAWTDEPVRFVFPGGTGEAVGLRYQSVEPRVRFGEEIAILAQRTAEQPVRITGSRLEYNASSRIFELAAPLQIVVGDRSLVADRLRLELDSEFRTRRIEAVGNARATIPQDGRTLTVRAAQAVGEYAAAGGMERLRASGQVEFQGKGPDSSERLSCQEAVFHFKLPGPVLERVVATGSPSLVVETAGETRSLRAPELELSLRGAGRQLLTARGRGTLVQRRRTGEERTVVADRLQIEFAENRQLRALAASGSVEMRESPPGSGPRSSTSDELRARFTPQGTLAAAEQWGRFRYRDERWQAQAGRADYTGAGNPIVLREQPVVWDASSRTSAGRIEFLEESGELRAEGDVRTTGKPAAGASDGFGSGEPVQLAAERLHAWPEERRARYEGRARLWQGENRLAASVIELIGEPGKLTATGEVSALFVEARSQGQSAESRRAVRVTAERFSYLAADRRAVFDAHVIARNDFGALHTPRLEVFLSSDSARLERVHAGGGVLIEQGGLQASSDEGEYRADAQTVVLWGGTPTLRDPQRGTTTGARLTLFLADDTLSIDSAEGTRTVTRRPWTQ